MCGRYTLASTTPAQLRARFPLGESVQIAQRFNVAPGDDVLAVVMRDGRPDAARCCAGGSCRRGRTTRESASR